MQSTTKNAKNKYGQILKKHAITNIQIVVDEKTIYQRSHCGNYVGVKGG